MADNHQTHVTRFYISTFEHFYEVMKTVVLVNYTMKIHEMLA